MITNVKTEVVGLSSTDTPQDFGYSEFSFTIVTEAKSWDTSTRVDTDTGTVFAPKIAADNSGRSIVIWKETNGTIANLWGNRYTPQAGWNTPLLLDNINTADVLNYDLTMDDEGNAVIVWYQHDGSAYKLFSKRYIMGTGWQAIEEIANFSASYLHYELATDGSGNTIVAWRIGSTIYVIRYLTTTGWETDPTLIYNGTSYSPVDISLSVTRSGKALVIWPNTNEYVYYSILDPDTGWSTATSMFSHTSYYSFYDLEAVMDDNSNITIIYNLRYSSSSSNTLYGRRYSASAGVSDEYNLGSVDTYARAKIGVDVWGNALAVWKPLSNTIRSVYYDIEFGWQSNVQLYTGSLFGIPNLAMDIYGNAALLWGGTLSATTQQGILYCNFKSADGWSSPALIAENLISNPAI